MNKTEQKKQEKSKLIIELAEELGCVAVTGGKIYDFKKTTKNL